MVLENGERRRKLGPKKDEWRKPHKEELYDVYYFVMCTAL